MSDTHTSAGGPVPGAGEDRRAQAREVLAAFNAHDAAAFASFYSPEAIAYDYTVPDPMRGRDAIQQDAEQFMVAFPDAELQVEEVLVDGDKAVTRWVCVGTHIGPLASPTGEVPPTGRRISIPMVVVSRWGEDGLIVDEHRYFDLMSMTRQLGLT
ncbi:ester cyclase [Kocuria arenosa]|uniref:ester cyclase n=1 Tax=Kocuria arenosa TaxID=3071446 RepID=UPI0034D42C04